MDGRVQGGEQAGEIRIPYVLRMTGKAPGCLAGHKRSVQLPAVREHLGRLGRELGWHGALSADVILGSDGPVFIDLNPRLVEPMNALLSGVDLLTPMLDLARGRTPAPQPPGKPGVASHQLLLAVLGAAQHSGRRRAVLGELAAAAVRRRGYAGSREEPMAGVDARSMLLFALAAGATLARPALWRWFASGSVAAYALSPHGWRRIVQHAPAAP
ncbi:hypothetical protein [Planobispora takensis]|uniref:hypothetical protein n=1 Tax=Planobispora takensis TaxID=1367882 RepID=UPI001942E8F2|nr:hypothetical protein [Planobispora takensis]